MGHIETCLMEAPDLFQWRAKPQLRAAPSWLGILTGPMHAWRGWRELRQLAAMTPRELRDIGLNSADIAFVRNLPLSKNPTEELARRVDARRRR